MSKHQGLVSWLRVARKVLPLLAVGCCPVFIRVFPLGVESDGLGRAVAERGKRLAIWKGQSRSGLAKKIGKTDCGDYDYGWKVIYFQTDLPICAGSCVGINVEFFSIL